MYTLRRISQEGVEINSKLGDSYVVVDREKNPKQFERDYNLLYGKETVLIELSDIKKQVYALVSNDGGSKIFELTTDSFYYIMTESGKTFSNLTFK
jgi:hypothetical protein